MRFQSHPWSGIPTRRCRRLLFHVVFIGGLIYALATLGAYFQVGGRSARAGGARPLRSFVCLPLLAHV